ncbi:MAG: hypothetical protein K2P57_04580 [Burkholderiales bacterium]|nr:hypothetical protein [Burkholderiales bacterium]
MKRSIVFLATLCFAQSSPFALAQEQTQDQVRQSSRQQIYGSQLMTPEERTQYRTQMRSAKTREERETLRREHHKQMQERAREKGVQLPDMPAAGQGMGPGGGMGSGGGMGRRGGY